MAMPKGHRMQQGYATVKDGMDYRAISEIMTERGYKMNHATARNVLLSAMRSLAKDLLLARGEGLETDRIEQIARSPMFQSGVSDSVSDLTAAGDLEV
jgi:hypothetical protein